MEHNLTFEEISVFTWDIDGTMWSSFNTPFAQSVYKWTAIIIFLNVFDVVFLMFMLVWMILYCVPNLILFLNDMRNIFNKDYSKTYIEQDKKIIFGYYQCLGSILHGHELFGLENIPDSAVVYNMYHAPLGIDGMIAYAKLSTKLTRDLYGTAHYKEANLYGFRRGHQSTNYCSFTRQEIIDRLKQGCQFSLSVGGIEESRISDNNYRIFRAKRYGLAHIAKATGVPILPLFTRNVHEAYWIPWFARPFVKKCPKKYLAAIPSAGGLPVKLTTFIGKPIDYDPSASVEEIMDKIYDGMQDHIDKYQIVPGNKLRALKERFYKRNYTHIITV